MYCVCIFFLSFFLFCFILNVFQATHGIWLLKMHVTSFWVMVAGSRFPLLWYWLTGCTKPWYWLTGCTKPWYWLTGCTKPWYLLTGCTKPWYWLTGCTKPWYWLTGCTKPWYWLTGCTKPWYWLTGCTKPWYWLTGCTKPGYLPPFSASCFPQCEGLKAWDTTGSCWHKAKNMAPSIACCLETEVQKKTVKQPEGWWDNSPCQWHWHCMGQSSMGFPEHLATIGVVMLAEGEGGE